MIFSLPLLLALSSHCAKCLPPWSSQTFGSASCSPPYSACFAGRSWYLLADTGFRQLVGWEEIKITFTCVRVCVWGWGKKYIWSFLISTWRWGSSHCCSTYAGWPIRLFIYTQEGSVLLLHWHESSVHLVMERFCWMSIIRSTGCCALTAAVRISIDKWNFLLQCQQMLFHEHMCHPVCKHVLWYYSYWRGFPIENMANVDRKGPSLRYPSLVSWGESSSSCASCSCWNGK